MVRRKSIFDDKISEAQIARINATLKRVYVGAGSWKVLKWTDQLYLGIRTHSIAGSADFDYIEPLTLEEALYCINELNIPDHWGVLKEGKK